MGFKDEDEFMAFRKRCNKISYNLRKNQYAQSLAVKIDRLERLVEAANNKLDSIDELKYKDKYGWEAKKEQDEKDARATWTPSQVGAKKTQRVSLYVSAQRALETATKLQKVDEENAKKLVDRTLAYLKSTGIAETEEELESLAARSAAIHYDGDVTAELEKVREATSNLDKATEVMNKQRTAMSATIKRVTDAELAILDLERVNKRILNACLYEKNKQTRNRMLLTKLDNESKLVELRALVKKTKKDNAKGFEALEAMRKEVDSRQILHK